MSDWYLMSDAEKIAALTKRLKDAEEVMRKLAACGSPASIAYLKKWVEVKK